MAIKLSDIFGSADLNINNPKLEEMLNKTKDMAETVGKKSAERLEMSRKMIECLDAKTKLSKLYERYGEIQYNGFIGDEIDTVELEGIANRIADLKTKIDELNAEIDEAKVEFSEAVVNATKKTRDVFQKEFDKMNKAEVIIPNDEVEVTEAKSEE